MGSIVHMRRGWIGSIALFGIIAVLAFSPVGLPDTGASEGRGSSTASALAQTGTATPVAGAGCDALAPGVGAEAWIRAELYFGATLPDGSEIPESAWRAFLDEEITPRFPAGLTVLEGYGQFLTSRGVIAKETSIVLIIFYPADSVAESSEALEEIRAAYETRFDQESVLRADAEPVCISF